MPIKTLAELSLGNVPYTQVPYMSLKQRTVVHYELYPRMTFWSRSLRGRRMDTICRCVNFGRCLCYLEIIRVEMVEQYWAEADKYRNLSGWYVDA